MCDVAVLDRLRQQHALSTDTTAFGILFDGQPKEVVWLELGTDITTMYFLYRGKGAR